LAKPKTPIPLVASLRRPFPALFCVTVTQVPATEQVNVEGLVSVIACGVEEGFVTIASTLRRPI
jgi:hypothetical protein